MTRKLIIGAALALLLLAAGLPPVALAVLAALVLGAYAIFGMRDHAPVFTHDPGPAFDQPAHGVAPDDRYIPPAPSPLPAWHAPLQSIMVRLAPFCGDAINAIGLKTFEADPILTPEQTRVSGIIRDAISRHGTLIERTILECLQDREDLAVWCEPSFRLSHGDTNYHKAVTVEGSALATLPYGDGDAEHRTVQVDLIVFDKKSGLIRAYEIKRKNLDGMSAHNLQCVRSLLISYAETVKQLRPTRAEAWTISYYGTPHKSAPCLLTRGELDKHFGCPVVANVERATKTYRDDLQAILTPEKAA